MKHLRRRVITEVKGESLTHQSFRNECDINQIMNKYRKTGQMTHLSTHRGAYGDFTNIGDYQESLNKVILADEAFASLPAHLRKRFGNSPENYLEFILNNENREEAEKLGIVERRHSPKQETSVGHNDDDSTTTTRPKATPAQAKADDK